MSAFPGAGGLRRAFDLIGRRPFAWCGAVLSAGLALAIVLLALIGATSLRPVIEQGGLPAQATVLIAPGASAADEDALRASLLKLDLVATVTFVSRDAALAQIAARSPADREAIGQLAANPLPDVFAVLFRPDAAADAIDAQAAALHKMPHVDAVQIDLSWYRKFRAALRLARLAGGAMLVFFGFNALAWLLVAICLCVPVDAAQVRLLRLLGADDRLIRRPAVIAGSITAIAAGAVALGGTRLAWVRLDAESSALAAMYASALRLQWPELSWIAAGALVLCLAGALLASIGARVRLAAVGDCA